MLGIALVVVFSPSCSVGCGLTRTWVTLRDRVGGMAWAKNGYDSRYLVEATRGRGRVREIPVADGAESIEHGLEKVVGEGGNKEGRRSR